MHDHSVFSFWAVLGESALDSLKVLPFLFLAFLFMEYLEHKAGDKFTALLRKTGGTKVAGPALGALLGCIPQCGFSAAAASLFAGRVISAGTLIAVFLATSDEAIPILLSNPGNLHTIWQLIAIKIIIAIIFGTAISFVYAIFGKKSSDTDFEDLCRDCGCGEHGILRSAMRHTANIFAFILIINILLGTIVGLIGEEAFFGFIESFGVFQPAVAALVGLIPNCASSVFITELYIEGGLSFGSTVAGLCSGAGVGLMVLYKSNKHLKENIIITVLLYLIAVFCGVVINLAGGA
ncbi:MAG: arsenic efflux protein [Ruminococcus sp.]|jgi:hypothetical protein|nr:arsenic efflux protein [Ruminococcus sp.]